jgi:uncharacterized RDD family membrane protein YckC
MARAGFLARLLAFLIDNIALGVISWALSLLALPFLNLAEGDAGLMAVFAGGAVLFLALILLLLQFLYFGWLWSKSGQSLGMKVVNIRVAREDGSGLGFARAGLRGTVGYWISGLIFGLGFLWAAFDGRKQAWHDKIFDTGVFTA